MKDMFDKLFALGLGLAVVSKEQVEKIVDELVKKGEMAPVEAKKVVSELLERGKEEKEQLMGMVRNQVKKALPELDIITKEDLTRLEQRLIELEGRVRRLEAQQPPEEGGRCDG